MDEVVPRDTLGERVMMAALRTTAALATDFRLPLKRMKQLTELAYYRENRRRGYRMKEIQEVMGVGFSKVGTLSRQLKEHHAQPGSGLGIQRRLVLLLWAVPLTQKHLLSVFPEVDNALVLEQLQALVAEGVLVEEQGRTPTYRVEKRLAGLVKDRWVARLEALNSLMGNVTQVIQQRFFPEHPDEEPMAFVRTLHFRARPEDVERLEAVYRDVVLPLVQELDAQVEADAPSVPLRLSYLWALDNERDTDGDRTS
ncbi:MAG: hypothetical protein AAFX99_23870 [Myxococcota bacterium]